jgi:hypothetical protein
VWLVGTGALTSYRSERLGDPIEELASSVFARRPELGRAASPAGEALRSLLRWLADRQSAIGIELLGRLGQRAR